MVRDIDRRGAWDDRIVDALCDPPESFVLGSVVAHVLTFSAHRRQLVRQMLRGGGHEVDERRPDRLARARTRGAEAGMTRTIYYTATTLDGYLADEHDSLDWLFDQDQDEEGPLNYDEFIAGVGAIVMGATTYEWILAHLQDRRAGPTTAGLGVHPPRPAEPTAPTSGSSAATSRPCTHEEIAAAAGGKDVWVVGGGDLAAQFAEAGLLDEMIAYIAPVTLGAGRPLFPRPLRPPAGRAAPEQGVHRRALRRRSGLGT